MQARPRLSDEDIERAATKACRTLGYDRLKEEQLRVVSNVIRQKDVFAVLPTGYGKSLCFACLPLGMLAIQIIIFYIQVYSF